MWIVLWDPFLIKILLKKEICRSHEQCTESTEKTEMHFLKKKKKKKPKPRLVVYQLYPNVTLV